MHHPRSARALCTIRYAATYLIPYFTALDVNLQWLAGFWFKEHNTSLLEDFFKVVVHLSAGFVTPVPVMNRHNIFWLQLERQVNRRDGRAPRCRDRQGQNGLGLVKAVAVPWIG